MAYSKTACARTFLREALLNGGDYQADPAQRRAAGELDRVWTELNMHPVSGWWMRLRGKQSKPITGLYLWGSVGRGKTWLMDMFFDSLPGDDKQRIHFHRFMARVHSALKNMPNTRDPLPTIARHWAEPCRVLCFDEFFVADIADAMLLGGLLESLFAEGVTLIATSNVPPDQLYQDGLQRARFLPAIEALKTHTLSVHVDGTRDFRLRILQRSEIYLHPLNDYAEASLANAFNRMSGDCALDPKLEVNGRILHARQRSDGIIWFNFETLCEHARSTSDYIEIARAFNTVLLSGIPQMNAGNADTARRFINLIDEFYDHNVKMLISAAMPINDLYNGKRLSFEFQRTTSRLTEMQSHTYLAKPHLP